jgi:hypothetical protein
MVEKGWDGRGGSMMTGMRFDGKEGTRLDQY